MGKTLVAALGCLLVSTAVYADIATELASDDDHRAAALEFRRLALSSRDKEQRGGYFWASAYEYWQAGTPGTASKMLEREETAWPADLEVPTLLLKAELATDQGQTDEAIFYAESVMNNEGAEPEAKAVAARAAAVNQLRSGSKTNAVKSINRYPEYNTHSQAALKKYMADSDKSIVFGGLLSLVPGLGYLYAGEYVNALKSFLLNGVFIFGMINTADNEEWGAFAVITAFETAWYANNVTGSIEACRRYNETRLETCLNSMEKETGFRPDYRALPAVSLQYKF